MSRLTMMQNGMPVYSMKSQSPVTQNLGGNINFVPNQRETNHITTQQQVNNYAFNKEMMSQGTADMRGNVAGYGETLG